MAHLSCHSFHSVKGGVGKSTLSTFVAIGLAERETIPVYLVDMDLTGTSLADVLPLCAPAWPEGMALDEAPSGHHSRKDSLDLMEVRGSREDRGPSDVPFLNDFFLFADASWDGEADLPIDRLCWRLEGGPENLRVIPSSALPRDLEAILPMIFSEEEAAFLEGRMEYLLEGILGNADDAIVVFDTPPTIPGLSRSVLSLALRLSKEVKEPLASEDSFIPPRLKAAELAWRANLIATMDLQDLRAIHRWLDLVGPSDEERIRVVINRIPPGDDAQIERLLSERLGQPSSLPNGPELPPQPSLTSMFHPLLQAPLRITLPLNKGLEFFRREGVPRIDRETLSRLLQEGESP